MNYKQHTESRHKEPLKSVDTLMCNDGKYKNAVTNRIQQLSYVCEVLSNSRVANTTGSWLGYSVCPRVLTYGLLMYALCGWGAGGGWGRRVRRAIWRRGQEVEHREGQKVALKSLSINGGLMATHSTACNANGWIRASASATNSSMTSVSAGTMNRSLSRRKNCGHAAVCRAGKNRGLAAV